VHRVVVEIPVEVGSDQVRPEFLAHAC
jgi:hypothetical protein